MTDKTVSLSNYLVIQVIGDWLTKLSVSTPDLSERPVSSNFLFMGVISPNPVR